MRSHMQLQSHTDRIERSSLCHFKRMPHRDIAVDSLDQNPCISHLYYCSSHWNCVSDSTFAPLPPIFQEVARMVFIKCEYHNPAKPDAFPSNRINAKSLLQPIQFYVTWSYLPYFTSTNLTALQVFLECGRDVSISGPLHLLCLVWKILYPDISFLLPFI